MKTRIITSVVGLAFLAVVLFFFDTIIFNIVVASFCLIAIHEAYAVFNLGKKGGWIFAGLVPPVLLHFLLPVTVAQVWGGPLLCVVLLYFALCVVLMFPHIDFARVGGAVLLSAFVGVSFYCWIALKHIFPPVKESPVALYFLMLSLCYAWGGDSMAYFTGLALGKHKMAPELSPKKTVEGAVGGVLGGIVLGEVLTFFMLTFFAPAVSLAVSPYILVAGLGLVCTLLGILGDLLASAVKRQMDVKDYGTFFPGHGGILDRFDSVLLIAPVALFAALWVAGWWQALLP